MRAYVFLGQGATGLFDGRRWPTPGTEPGEWVSGSASGPDAVRAYAIGELPYWIDDELWRIEVAGDVFHDAHLTRASRGRLCERVERWDDDAAHAMAFDCARRARDAAGGVLRAAGHHAEADALDSCDLPPALEEEARRAEKRLEGAAERAVAYVADAVLYARDAPTPGGAAAVSAYISARAVGCAAPAEDYASAFAAEREWQAEWLCRRLGLSPLVPS